MGVVAFIDGPQFMMLPFVIFLLQDGVEAIRNSVETVL